jgi:hypothetical protein
LSVAGPRAQDPAVPAANQQWRVLPHGPIEPLEANLWRVEGSLEGMPLRRVMTIARRSDGKLVLHNGIALEDDAMRRLEALGEPAILIVPNGFHRLDAPAFKQRYPALQVVCPAGARKRVEAVVAVDRTYDDAPADADVAVRHIEGTRRAEGVMIVRHGATASSVVLNDLVFNMPHIPGFIGWVLRHVTASSGGPRVSRIARLFLVADKQAFADDLRTLAALPGLRRVIVSHHEVIDHEPARVLREVAATLAVPRP